MTHLSDSAYQCGKAGKRILFVDDEEDYCHLISLMAEGYGINMDVHSSRQDAMEVCHLYDILVTDLDFGKEGKHAGFELAKFFKGAQSNGVVILITGHHDIDHMVGEPIDFKFIKPIMFDDFINLLLKAVELVESKSITPLKTELVESILPL